MRSAALSRTSAERKEQPAFQGSALVRQRQFVIFGVSGVNGAATA